jgi:hypothetical protein
VQVVMGEVSVHGAQVAGAVVAVHGRVAGALQDAGLVRSCTMGGFRKGNGARRQGVQ